MICKHSNSVGMTGLCDNIETSRISEKSFYCLDCEMEIPKQEGRLKYAGLSKFERKLIQCEWQKAYYQRNKEYYRKYMKARYKAKKEAG